MAEYDAKIVVSADTRRADTSLDKLQAKLDQLAKTASGVGTGSIQGGIRAATQGIQNFGQEAKNVLSRGLFTGAILGVGQLSASISTATASLGPLTGAVRAAGSAFNSSLGGVPAVVGDILSQIGHIPNAMGLATVAAMAFAPQLLKASSAAVGLGSAIDKAIGAQTVTNIAGIVTGLNKVEETIKRTAAPMELLRAELSQAKQELDKYVSFTQESVVAANQLLAVEKMLTAEKRAQNALLGAVDPNAARRLQLQQRIARIRRGEEGGSAAFRESIARQAQIREAGSRSLYMRAEGRVALSEQSTAAAETARQIEKLNDRQRDFIARTDEAAQAANRQTAAFLRQQRIAKQVAALNLAAPAAQLMLPAAAPGSPAMSGGARRRITGQVERLGGRPGRGRTLDEAQATLRLAQANTQLAQSTKKVDAEFNRFLPDTNLLNATARGIQRIQTNQEAFNESLARGTRFQQRYNQEQERLRRLGIGVPSMNMPGATGRTAGPFPVEGPIPLSQFGRRPQAAAPGRRGTNRLGGVVSNAVIGGAFPLLFGQGGGAATGGALGGALGGLLGGTGGFAGSLLGTLLGGIAEQGGKIKELAADIGFSAEQTRNLQEAFKLAGTDAEKFTAAVQNIRGLGLELNDQASVVQALTQLTAAYGGSIDKTANAFTSALESGKVTQATLNQLTSQNIPIQDKLAASYNVTRSELLQMAKDGKISVQDLANAFVDLANESAKGPGKTRTAYEEAFEQISLAVDNLTTKIIASFDLQADKAQSTGETLVTRIAGAFTNILRSIEPVVLLLSQTTGALVNLGIAAVNALSGIPNLISNVTSSVIGMIPGLGASYKILSAIAALRQNGGRAPGIASPTNLNQGMSQNWPAGIPRPGTTPQIDRIRVPSQLPPGGSAGAKAKKDKTAEELQRSLEQGRALAQEFARQVKLLNTTTDIERKRLQIQFDFEDRQKQISELKNAEQRTSLTTQNQEIRRLELIDLQTEALKKQTDEAEKLFDIIIQGYNFGISREGGTGAGIFGKLSELKQNLDPIKVQVDSIATGATVIGDAFSLAFGEIISGAKSTEQALADTFQQIGDAFINMAVNIIAQQMTMIILGSILKALGLGFNLSGTNALSTGSSPLGGIGGSLGGAGYGGVSGITPIGPSFGGATFPAFFADGGFVTGPTRAMVGEGGQAEYIIPASKMRSAMSRYAAGARGSAVIPAGDDTSGGGTATMAPAAIDVRYTVERINSVDYVTADQFRTGMAQAAQQGATQGEQRTLRRLQQSRATRSRLGMN